MTSGNQTLEADTLFGGSKITGSVAATPAPAPSPCGPQTAWTPNGGMGDHKRAEDRIAQLNRAQAILTGIDRAIVLIPDRQKLLDEVCRIAVEAGGFKLAWVGMIAPDGSVQPVAQAGATGYLDGIRVTTHNEPEGCGPSGTAIRLNRPVVIEEGDRDPCMAPWHGRLRQFGLRYVAAFPIRVGGKVAGFSASLCAHGAFL